MNRKYVREVGGMYALILCIPIFFSACVSKERTQSILFQTIFLEKEGLFRGINLGNSLEEVKKYEKVSPRHDDLIGLTYYYPLADSQQLFLEYYSGLPESGLRGDSLKAIIANVFLQDEMVAAELYREIQNHFKTKMGLSLGDYGEDVWEGETRYGQMEVHLKFSEGGRGISINFVELNN